MYNSLFYYLLKSNTQQSQSYNELVRAEWFTRHGGGDFESQVFSSLAGDPWDTCVAFHFLSYELERPVYL